MLQTDGAAHVQTVRMFKLTIKMDKIRISFYALFCLDVGTWERYLCVSRIVRL